MERMLTTIKEHVHPSMTDQADTTSRGADLVMKTAASRATKYPQGTEGAMKKEVSIRAESIIKKIIPEGTVLDTKIHQRKTSLMDLAVFTMHTSTEKGFSNHLMRDCRMFVKLQEALELNQGAKPRSTTYDKRTVN
jgi:hypothetical protein